MAGKKTQPTKQPSEMKSISNKDLKNDFNKRFGEGTFFTFGDNDRATVVPISSGIPTFDYASGIGGIPSGRIIEVYGPESNGKTSFCLMLVASFQRLARLPGPFFGKKAGFIDAEHALDPLHVENLGVDVSPETGMLVNQPDSGEQAFDLMEAMCNSGQFGLVIVDSAAAMVPQDELENDMGYNPIGLQARMLGKGLRKLKGPASKSNTSFVFINQIREKPGIQGRTVTTTPGGKALKFYASMRIEIRGQKIEKNGSEIGLATTAKFVKNKVARPFTVAEYDYHWIGGVDQVKNIMDAAISTGVIHRRGAYYFYGSDADDTKSAYMDNAGNKLMWQGSEPLLEVLRTSPSLYEYTNNMVLGIIPKDAVFVDEGHEEDEDEEPTEEQLLLEV